MSSRSFYVVTVIDTQYFCVCMLLNLLNKCACILNIIEISILFLYIDRFKDRVLFVRMYKTTGYYLSACSNRRGTICPCVQIDRVLFVRMCKSTGYYLSACAKMTGYYLSGVLFVRDSLGDAWLWPYIQRNRYARYSWLEAHRSPTHRPAVRHVPWYHTQPSSYTVWGLHHSKHQTIPYFSWHGI